METEKLIAPIELAFALMDDLATMYLYGIMSVQNKTSKELTNEDISSAENYAKAKFQGIASEFEIGYEWRWAENDTE